MSFWNKVKRFFGADAPDDPEAGAPTAPGADPLNVAIGRAIADKAKARAMFVPTDILAVVQSEGEYATIEVIRAIEAFYKSGGLGPFSYTRTNHVYHPIGTDAASYESMPPPARSAPRAPAGSPAAPVASRAAPASAAAPPPPEKSPYEAAEILGFSAAEMRKRALTIKPWSTAWIAAVDTIPPQSDERTALIDRGLLLRGLLTKAQLDEIHRIGDLWLHHNRSKRMAYLRAQGNVDQALAEERRKKAEARALKRAEAAERREARRAAIAERKATDIVFAGRGVSGRLGDRRANLEALERRDLPVLATPKDLADALGLDVGQLRWLTFHEEATERPHYVYFQVPKRSGGMRKLSAPHRKLAACQKWILHNVLEKLPPTSVAHGFVKGRSTVTHASGHVGKAVVVNLDLEDFFPTITFPRVRGLFQRVGYSPAVATLLALLTTECPRTEVTYDGVRYFVATGDRALPQGACTSPAISNLVSTRLDKRLDGYASASGLRYTRYADDLTFSASTLDAKLIGRVLARVRHLVEEEGFRINVKKGRALRAAGRQDVTGIVVNKKLGVPRDEVRRLRALLHQASKTGLEAQNRQGLPSFSAYVRGKIAYVEMVDREKGARLREAFEKIVAASPSR